MQTEERDVPLPPVGTAAAPFPSAAETVIEVNRLIDAGLFPANSRTHHLLDYLIDHARRSGSRAPVKAISIAIDVLGRDETFDPSVDSIVRVEVGRLRKLLDLYYAGQGAGAPLQFRIPRGQTRIEVRPAHAPGPAARPLQGRVGRPPALVALALVGVIVIALIGVAVSGGRDRLPPPRIIVEPTDIGMADVRLEPIGHGVSVQLLSDLSNFRTFRVVPRELLADPVLTHADYLLRTQVSGTYPRMLTTIVLVRGADMSVAWSGSRLLDLSTDGPDEFGRMIRDLVQRICGPQGACEADALARLEVLEQDWGQRPPRQFDCILRFHGFDRSKTPSARARVETCLRDLVQHGVANSAIWSAKAFMLLLAWSEMDTHDGGLGLADALRIAARAVAIDPASADGHEALGSVLTAQGRLAAARTALEQAASLNPSNAEIGIKLGWIDCLEQQWERCVARISDQVSTFVAVPGWYRIPLAIHAFHAADVQALAEQGELIAASGDPRGLIFALASARLANDMQRAEVVQARIADIGSTEAALLSQVRHIYPDPDMMDRLAGIVVRANVPRQP